MGKEKEKIIYMDNAATTPLCKDVKEFISNSLDEYLNPSSSYPEALEEYKKIRNAGENILDLLETDKWKYDIYFTSGATEGNNWALRSVAKSSSNGCKIITSEIEHPSVYNTVKDLSKSEGCEAVFIKADRSGVVYADEMVKEILEPSKKAKLVSLMLANNQLGSIQPVRKIGEACKKANAIFHVDATQAVGKMLLNFESNSIDILTASAHKFGGMKGVGFLICKKEIDLPPLLTGGNQNKGKRAGTENVIGILSTEIALRDSLSYLGTKYNYKKDMCLYILKMLKDDRYIINSPLETLGLGILNISLPSLSGTLASAILAGNGIYVSKTSACESNEAKTNRVLAACGYDAKRIENAIRISLSANNTYDECDKLIEVLNRITEI